MFKRSLLALLLSGVGVAQASDGTTEGKLNVNQAKSTVVTLFTDKALISQNFDIRPDETGRLEIAGLSINQLDGSLNLEYIDGETIHRPEQVLWYQGGLDRENYYRSLVGKEVEVFGGGLNTAIVGTLVSYQQGIGLVEGSNHRQYFIDYHDPQGLRILSLEPLQGQDKSLNYLIANFGQQSANGALRLSYITPLLNYDSHYRLTLLSDHQGRLELKALLANSSGTHFNDARIRLVSGGEGGVPGFFLKTRRPEVSMADAVEYGERVGEVLLTTLPEDTALLAHSKQLLDLFSKTVHLEKLYTLEIYGRSTGGRASMTLRPRLTWLFAAPLDLSPALVRTYESDPDGGYVISGHSRLAKTTVGDTARITMDEALAVRVEFSRLDAEQKGLKELLVKWQATVFNDQQENITLLLTERDSNLLRLESVTGGILEEPDQIRVEVAAGAKTAIEFTARYRH